MINVGIIGASGFTGLELARLLNNHTYFKLKWATSTSMGGKPLSALTQSLLPAKSNIQMVSFNSQLAQEVEAVFLALPHGQAMNLLPSLLDANKQLKIVDLSADYRLPPNLYEKWYQMQHASANLIDCFIYGLAELNKDKISQAQLVANPGCYATAVLLAVAPLLANHKDLYGTVIANCLSGISGAGRQPSDLVHFCHLNDNAFAYKPGWQHRHVPEMEYQAKDLLGASINISFTPHLIPVSRGILATVYCQFAKAKKKALYQLYQEFYAQAFFVHLLPPGELPEVKTVLGSNFCFLGLEVNETKGEVIIFAVLDNLVKGASGQAIQNLNLIFNLPEETGLTSAGVYP